MSIKRNTFWNLLGNGLPLLAAAICIPFTLKHLGNDAFGVLTLIWALIGYFSLFDFGTGRALTYEISRLCCGDNPAPHRAKIQPVLYAGLLFTLGTGLLGALLMFLLAPELVLHWLKIRPELQSEAQLAFQIAAIGIIPTTVTSGLRGAMEGMNFFLASNLNKIFLGFCMFLLPAVAIFIHGPKLPVITLYLIAARLITAIIGLIQLRNYFSLRRHTPGANSEKLHQLMRKLFSYGFWITISGIVGPLMVYGDRFFVSAAVGAAQLPVYAISQEALLRLLILPNSICGALLPVFAALPQGGELLLRYKANHKRILYIMLMLCTTAAIIVYPAFSIWISPAFAIQATPIALILCIGVLINSMALVPYTLLQARGNTKITAQYHVLELILYLATLFWLSTNFGLIGAAIAWVARVMLDYILLANAAKRLI